MEFNLENFKVQGVKVNYYYICKRKLWLYSKGITMEQHNDRVLMGKLVHENSYGRLQKREFLIDDLLKIDILDKNYVREVKISSKMIKADKMQLIYYLYYLDKLGIKKKGLINYVKEKKQEEIELTCENKKEIERALVDIKKISQQEKPPELVKLPYCTKCAYYEFCFIKEDL